MTTSLQTATRHRDLANAGLLATTDEAPAILQLTTTHLDAHHLLVYPRKSVGLADVGTPAAHIQKAEPLHLEDTTVDRQVTQATRHHNIAHPNKLKGRLAQLPQLARGHLPSLHGLAYLMGTVLNVAVRYQALHLLNPQGALHHACQQVAKAWAQHRGLPTCFPKEAMVAHWHYYGDTNGALLDMAYAKCAAHLLHRMTHNHPPGSCERIQRREE